MACRTTPDQVDPLGDAVETGAVQEIRADAAEPPRRHPPLDQDSRFQRSRLRHEQQDQVHQPSFVWISYRRELHRGDLPLLRPVAATSRTLIALLGYEPKQGCGPVSLVVVGHGSAAPLLNRQSRLGSVQRLDLAFLVCTKDDGM